MIEEDKMTRAIEKGQDIHPLDIIKDNRVDCYSIMVQSDIESYLNKIEKAFAKKGGLEKQRDTLKTTTAINIRKRMIDDIQAGTVLPPIVLGILVSEDEFRQLDNIDYSSFLKWLTKIPDDALFIIDGMQRTTALKEALERKYTVSEYKYSLNYHKIRLEYWISSNLNSLAYRMLVLNTGQIPWNLRRQIETIFYWIIKEMKQRNNKIEILEIDDNKRRSKPGQFQGDRVIDLFLCFGTRKEKIDLQERLAEEFTKLDLIEAIEDEDFTENFYQVFDYLTKFDNAFSIYTGSSEIQGNFKKGLDLFSCHPACIGFVTAIALAIWGRPSVKYSPEKTLLNWGNIKYNADKLLEKLAKFEDKDLEIFLDFSTLNQLISRQNQPRKSSSYEREFFLAAFKTLIEEKFDIDSMTVCWRSY